MNLPEIINIVFAFIYRLASIAIAVLAVLSAVWYIKSFKKVTALEKKIFEKQREYDDMEQTTHAKTRGTVNQGQLDRLVAKNREPVEKELNLLKMERQFILDKLPLVGFFKR